MKRRAVFSGESARNLGQNIETIDASGHAEFVLSIFNSHHGRLATRPLFFAKAQFGWKDEYDFEFAAFRDVLVCIYEDTAHA